MKRGELCMVIVMCMIRNSYKLREEKRFRTNTTTKTITDPTKTITIQPTRPTTI